MSRLLDQPTLIVVVDAMLTVDAGDCFAEDGSLPESPAGLRRRALLVAQCIEYGTDLPEMHAMETLIPCRRRPDGRACIGLLWLIKTERDDLHAFCNACHTEVVTIHNWQDTPWADGPMEPIPFVHGSSERVASKAHDVGNDARAGAPQVHEKADAQLAKALARISSSLEPDTVRSFIATAESPNSVLQAVMESGTTDAFDAGKYQPSEIYHHLWRNHE